MMQGQGPQQEAQMRLQRMMDMYKQNPGAFTPEETKQLYTTAQQMGMADEMPNPGGGGGPVKNFLQGLVNVPTLGLADNAIARAYTPGDETARNLGETLGSVLLAVTGGKILGKAGAAWVKGLAKTAPQAEQLAAGARAAEVKVTAAQAAMDRLRSVRPLERLGGLAAKNPKVSAAIEQGLAWGAAGAAPDVLRDPGQALQSFATWGLPAAAVGGFTGAAAPPEKPPAAPPKGPSQKLINAANKWNAEDIAANQGAMANEMGAMAKEYPAGRVLEATDDLGEAAFQGGLTKLEGTLQPSMEASLINQSRARAEAMVASGDPKQVQAGKAWFKKFGAAQLAMPNVKGLAPEARIMNSSMAETLASKVDLKEAATTVTNALTAAKANPELAARATAIEERLNALKPRNIKPYTPRGSKVQVTTAANDVKSAVLNRQQRMFGPVKEGEDLALRLNAMERDLNMYEKVQADRQAAWAQQKAQKAKPKSKATETEAAKPAAGSEGQKDVEATGMTLDKSADARPPAERMNNPQYATDIADIPPEQRKPKLKEMMDAGQETQVAYFINRLKKMIKGPSGVPGMGEADVLDLELWFNNTASPAAKNQLADFLAKP